MAVPEISNSKNVFLTFMGKRKNLNIYFVFSLPFLFLKKKNVVFFFFLRFRVIFRSFIMWKINIGSKLVHSYYEI